MGALVGARGCSITAATPRVEIKNWGTGLRFRAVDWTAEVEIR